MSKPIQKTAFLGLLAAISVGIASFFYPWPERVVESESVGQALFEEYDASSVRSISILEYDADGNDLERFELVRDGEKWIIPARNKFVATNSAQIAMVVNSLNNRTVLEVRSNDKSDHNTFGVVDPSEYQTAANRASLGTKVTLRNRKKQELASVIIGETLGGQQDRLKRFARIPGEPNVYVLDFDKTALTTDFKRWTSANLLQISQATGFDSIDIKSYRMDKDKLTTDEKKWVYDAINFPSKETKLQALNAEGEFQEVLPTQEIVDALNPLVAPKEDKSGRPVRPPFAQFIRFNDVRPKAPEATNALRRLAREDVTGNELDSLKEYGFAKAGFTYKLEFNAVGGEVIIRTGDFVSVSVYIGSLVENSTGGDLSLNYNVMLYASVDESKFPEPEEPAANDDPKKADAEKKAYLRLVEARKGKIVAARRRASELNSSFAKWYYVVPETIIAGLRPDLNLPSPEALSKLAEKPAEKPADKPAEKPDPSEGEPADAESKDAPDAGKANEDSTDATDAADGTKATEGESNGASNGESEDASNGESDESSEGNQ